MTDTYPPQPPPSPTIFFYFLPHTLFINSNLIPSCYNDRTIVSLFSSQFSEFSCLYLIQKIVLFSMFPSTNKSCNVGKLQLHKYDSSPLHSTPIKTSKEKYQTFWHLNQSCHMIFMYPLTVYLICDSSPLPEF
jgi:hypothetical protein